MSSTTPTKINIIHCWSTPRARSTAFLYSFEARNTNDDINTIVFDEPLYYRWLLESPNIQRPYRNKFLHDEEVGSKWRIGRESYTDRLKESILYFVNKSSNAQEKEYVIFIKHMSKFVNLYDFDKECEVGCYESINNDFMKDKNIVINHKHMILLRDPIHVLCSWDASSSNHGDNGGNNGILLDDEVGFTPLLSVYSSIRKSRMNNNNNSTGSNNNIVIVLDSDELIANPKKILKSTCEELNISFKLSMLKWKAGSHKCDGPWAEYWYNDVHKSTGWCVDGDNNATSIKKSYPTLPKELLPTLRTSIPVYQFFKSMIKIDDSIPSPYQPKDNADILVYIGKPNQISNTIYPREIAKSISPWDSSVQGGDAVWEGLRVYNNGKILSLHRHIKRLLNSAKALDYKNVHTKNEIINAIFQTLAINNMRDNVHIRLTLTRGEKFTSSMNPKFNIYGTTLIVLPEYKPIEGLTTYDNSNGISCITSSVRRNTPSIGVDSKIHHCNMINNILPKIEANLAGVADAIMLDIDGYVSETNATNIFMVVYNNKHHNDDDDENNINEENIYAQLITPHADHCLPGITRETIIQLATEENDPKLIVDVRRVSLSEFYCADEVFTTGTMGELTPVVKIDGRVIGKNGQCGFVTKRLQALYKGLLDCKDWYTEIPKFD